MLIYYSNNVHIVNMIEFCNFNPLEIEGKQFAFFEIASPLTLVNRLVNTIPVILSQFPWSNLDVGAWLKSLRLHKYDWLVRGLEYQQLLSLDDAALEAKGVTKGARHKLMLSISRLGQRHQHLRAIEKVKPELAG